jgi:formamidopyrimidine-DNA glycosylase
MPELPEVEMYTRYFERHALRKRIAGVRVLDARICGSRKLGQLAGRSFERVQRHGKHLFADAGNVWLHIHFGMSGDLAYYVDAPPRFARLIFDFENGAHLAYEDMRLFGIVDLTRSPDVYIREHRLGPDPLDPQFNLRTFRALLHKRRGRIKALLMSQEVIAGIGNLYADEALFRSSVDPRRPIDRLRAGEARTLFTNIRRVLQETIAIKSRDADYPGRFLIQHREEGDRCPKCSGTIRRTIVAGRTTYYCAKHQR